MNPDSTRELLDLTHAVCTASEQADADLLARLIDDDFILVGPDGTPWDKSTALARWARPHAANVDASHDISEASMYILGDIGIVSAVITDRVRAGTDEHEWRERVFDVWRRSGDSWTLIASRAEALDP